LISNCYAALLTVVRDFEDRTLTQACESLLLPVS
jgi:hypothetical protein